MDCLLLRAPSLYSPASSDAVCRPGSGAALHARCWRRAKPRSRAVLERHIRQRPGEIGAEGPARANGQRMDAHLDGGIVQHWHLISANGGTRGDAGQIGPIAAAAARDHVAAEQPPSPKKKASPAATCSGGALRSAESFIDMSQAGDARHLLCGRDVKDGMPPGMPCRMMAAIRPHPAGADRDCRPGPAHGRRPPPPEPWQTAQFFSKSSFAAAKDSWPWGHGQSPGAPDGECRTNSADGEFFHCPFN